MVKYQIIFIWQWPRTSQLLLQPFSATFRSLFFPFFPLCPSNECILTNARNDGSPNCSPYDEIWRMNRKYANCCDILRCLLMTHYRSSLRIFLQKREQQHDKTLTLQVHALWGIRTQLFTSRRFSSVGFCVHVNRFSLKRHETTDNEANVKEKYEERSVNTTIA